MQRERERERERERDSERERERERARERVANVRVAWAEFTVAFMVEIRGRIDVSNGGLSFFEGHKVVATNCD